MVHEKRGDREPHLISAIFSSACFTFSRIISSKSGKNSSMSIFRRTRFRCAALLELNFLFKNSGISSNGSWNEMNEIAYRTFAVFFPVVKTLFDLTTIGLQEKCCIKLIVNNWWGVTPWKHDWVALPTGDRSPINPAQISYPRPSLLLRIKVDWKLNWWHSMAWMFRPWTLNHKRREGLEDNRPSLFHLLRPDYLDYAKHPTQSSAAGYCFSLIFITSHHFFMHASALTQKWERTCLFLDLIFAFSRAMRRHKANVCDKLQYCSA